MKQLQTENELRRLFSPAEQSAYLNDAGLEQPDIKTNEINMNFESPARGRLNIKGYHKVGEKNFVIKFMTEFYSLDEDLIKRKLTLVADALTGVITAMLSQGDNGDSANKEHQGPIKDIPELNWTEIKRSLQVTGNETVWQLQKEGFEAFSAGQVTIPPVIHMPFKGHGDLHLKGAHKYGGEIYVFKIVTGFPKNSERGLLPTQGMMIAFDATTGAPLVMLQDEGHLTDLRTAIAGRNAAQELMPPNDLTGIGVLGTGVQARLQLAQLQGLYPHCKKLVVWGRTPEKAFAYAKEMTENGWQVTVADSPRKVADHSNLIITTTPSEEALLDADDITAANTLIIAIGADMPGKIELSPALLKKADRVLIDSISQGKDHGNATGAIRDGVISEFDLQEFGDFLLNGFNQNEDPKIKKAEAEKKLTIFLSSGIGVQDLQIVQAVTESSKG
jgi:ornithine cyclodeaminase